MENKCYLYPVKSPYPYGIVPKNYKTSFYKETEQNFSAGLCINYNGLKVVFVDGRYKLAAENNLNRDFRIFDYKLDIIYEWIEENIPRGSSILFNGNEYTIFEIEQLKNRLIWYELIPQKLEEKQFFSSEIFMIEDISYDEKFEEISKIFDKEEYMLINDCLSIAWLTNIRSYDDEYTPILLGRAILRRNGDITIYSENCVTNPGIVNNSKIRFKSIKLLEKDLEKLDKVMTDFKETPYNFSYLRDKFCDIENPFLRVIPRKNSLEIENFRKCHIVDGIAITKLLYWLYQKDKVTEVEVSEKIDQLRKSSSNFLCKSFENIIAINRNSAEIHHKIDMNMELSNFDIILIDSGGQYRYGTTDITRTISKNPTNEQKRLYTLVLKGHINLFLTEFSKDTPSSKLDEVARQFLLREGVDYAHGTGHGVGYISHVHEPCVSISTRDMNFQFVPNMVLSNEPGVYLRDKFGIRIENMMYVVSKNEKLAFKSLTVVPYCRKLIDRSLLSVSEINWLNSYHEMVYKEIEKYLTPDESNWLREETAKL